MTDTRDNALITDLGFQLFALIGGETNAFAAVKAKLLKRKKPAAKKYCIYFEEDGLDPNKISASLDEDMLVAVRCSRKSALIIWPSLAEKCRDKVKVHRDAASLKSPHVAQGSLVAMRADTTWCIGGFLDQRDCQSAGRVIVAEAKRKSEQGKRDFFVSRPQAIFDQMEKQQRLEHLFPSVNDHSKLNIDEEAAYSVSNEISAAKVAQVAKRLAGECLDGEVAIIDATACVGGNTLAFARIFKTVVAIEIDNCKAEFLKRNLEHIRSEGNKVSAVKVVLGDCLVELPRILAEMTGRAIVFADPPWGGRHYTGTSSVVSTSDVHLKGSGNLATLVQTCLKNSQVEVLLLKLPSHFDHRGFIARDCSSVTHHDVIFLSDKVTLLALHFSGSNKFGFASVTAHALAAVCGKKRNSRDDQETGRNMTSLHSKQPENQKNSHIIESKKRPNNKRRRRERQQRHLHMGLVAKEAEACYKPKEK